MACHFSLDVRRAAQAWQHWVQDRHNAGQLKSSMELISSKNNGIIIVCFDNFQTRLQVSFTSRHDLELYYITKTVTKYIFCVLLWPGLLSCCVLWCIHLLSRILHVCLCVLLNLSCVLTCTLALFVELMYHLSVLMHHCILISCTCSTLAQHLHMFSAA